MSLASTLAAQASSPFNGELTFVAHNATDSATRLLPGTFGPAYHRRLGQRLDAVLDDQNILLEAGAALPLAAEERLDTHSHAFLENILVGAHVGPDIGLFEKTARCRDRNGATSPPSGSRPRRAGGSAPGHGAATSLTFTPGPDLFHERLDDPRAGLDQFPLLRGRL